MRSFFYGRAEGRHTAAAAAAAEAHVKYAFSLLCTVFFSLLHFFFLIIPSPSSISALTGSGYSVGLNREPFNAPLLPFVSRRCRAGQKVRRF